MNNEQPFSDAVMTCCVCGKQSTPGGTKDWRCIEVDKVRHYACRAEFPPDGSSEGQFELAYKRVAKTILEKQTPAPIEKLDLNLSPEDLQALAKPPKCRKCGCTEDRACSDNGVACHWVLPDLCSACVPKLNERDVRKLSQVAFGVTLAGPEAFYLLAALQLALRHPGFTGLGHGVVLGVAQLLEEQVGVTENLQAIAAAGWSVNAGGLAEEPSIVKP